MTPSLWLGAAALVLVFFATAYRWAWQKEYALAKQWERRARAAGWCPVITPQIATRIMGDLFGKPVYENPLLDTSLPPTFAKPLGARGWDDAASLSAEADVSRLREWRKHRALRGIDHHTRHYAEGTIPSEWAREVMVFCNGGLEVDE